MVASRVCVFRSGTRNESERSSPSARARRRLPAPAPIRRSREWLYERRSLATSGFARARVFAVRVASPFLNEAAHLSARTKNG
jgi:hypothetical protein